MFARTNTGAPSNDVDTSASRTTLESKATKFAESADAALTKSSFSFGSLFRRGASSNPDITKNEVKDVTSEPEQERVFWGWRVAKSLWNTWCKAADLAPSPWDKVLKYGGPAVAATCGAIWFQTLVQLGLAGCHLFGDLLKPIAEAACILVPAFSANSILKGIEKVFHIDPMTGWKRQALVRGAQGLLLVGAAIFMQTLDLSMLTYGAWAGAVVGAGYLVTKFIKSANKAVWASVAAALILPWSHYLTQRTYDVTVLSAGPDPEVGAWNVGTDLSVGDHWKGLTLLGEQHAPTGKSGMVLLNRDVALYLPPHRTANAFNSDFTTLIGKQVRVTTIGGWMKFISPKLQPTIVKYEVINNPQPFKADTANK